MRCTASQVIRADRQQSTGIMGRQRALFFDIPRQLRLVDRVDLALAQGELQVIVLLWRSSPAKVRRSNCEMSKLIHHASALHEKRTK